LAEKWVKIFEHEGLYFEYWITFILYVFAKKSFNFESDNIYGTPSVYQPEQKFSTRMYWNLSAEGKSQRARLSQERITFFYLFFNVYQSNVN
jgi:hypothetical protein